MPLSIGHCALAVHSTHAFLVASRLVRHLVNGATQAVVLVLVQATHLLMPVSQAGVAGVPEQLVSDRHCTQAFIAELALTLHCAFGAEQPKPTRHGTHWLVVVSHAGLPATPAQSELVRHRTHWFSVGLALTLHFGVAPSQPNDAVQVTH